MKKIEGMSSAEATALYENILGSMRDVLGKQSKFIVILLDDPGAAHVVSSCSSYEVKEALLDAVITMTKGRETDRPPLPNDCGDSR